MTAWMIEKKIDGVPHWWGYEKISGTYLIMGWSADPNLGMRLARKEDAEAFIGHYEDLYDDVSVTEHEWPEVTP